VSADEIEVTGPGHELWRMRKPTAVRVIRLWKGGEPAYFQVTDPLIYNLMARGVVAGKTVNWLSRLSSGIVAPWKRAATQFLGFSFRNALVRDPVTAMFFSEESGPRSLVPYAHLAMGILGRIQKGEWSEDVRLKTELLSRALDVTTSDQHKGIAASVKSMLGEGIILNRQGENEVWSKLADYPGIAMSTFLKPVDVFNYMTGGRYLSQQGEALAREGAYLKSKARGESDAQAQMAYDKITGNFGERGTNGNLAALFRSGGFLNPNLQIMWQQYAKVTDPDPIAAARFVGLKLPMMTLYGAAAAAVNHMLIGVLYPDEDDRKAAYAQMGEISDRNNMAFMTIGNKFRMPFPDGIPGAFASFGYNSVHYELLKRPISAKDKAVLILDRVQGIPGWSDTIQPQAKTLLELQINFSFFQNDQIVKQFLKDQFPYEPGMQAWPDTPTIYRWLGGTLHLSPLQVRYAVQQAFSRQLDALIATADSLAGGPLLEPKDYPAVGGLVQPEPRGYRSQSVQTLKDLDIQYQSAKNRIKELEKEPAGEIDVKALAELRGRMAKLAGAHGQMMAVVRLFRAAKRLAAKPGNEEAVKGIERQMVTVARRYLEKAELPAQAPPAP
jgi:hypothetical protein